MEIRISDSKEPKDDENMTFSQMDLNEIEEENEEVVEKIEGEIVETEDDYPDDAVFKTGQVSRFLDIPAQMIRNALNLGWDRFVTIDNAGDKNGTTRKWTKKNVKQFRELLDIKKSTGWTFEEVIKYKEHPTTALQTAATDDKAFDKLMEGVRKNIDEKFNAIAVKQNNMIAELVDDKFKDNFNQLNSNIEKSLAHQEEILLIKKEEELAKQKEIENVNQLLLKQINLINEKIETLSAENKALQEQNAQLLEQTKKKKFSFFGK